MFSVNHLTNSPQSSVLGRTTSDQSLEGEKKACVCQPILLTFLIRNLKAKVIFRTMLFLFLWIRLQPFSLMRDPTTFKVEMYVPQDVKT